MTVPISKKMLTYIEIDIDHCALTYGTAPCTASIPTTGAIKCFNSLGTCQDRANFSNTPITIRFGMHGIDYLPTTIECIPSLTDVNFTPAIVSLGVDLGERATLEVVFKDHRSSDFDGGIIFDKYLSIRGYDPFTLGTFFGKFRARNPFLFGRNIRWITGYVGQALVDMEVRHFIIDSFDGPKPSGNFTIYAKDIFKLADGDRAQAPLLNSGFLSVAITNVATSATLAPAGIGNIEYPASGFIAIGGAEIVSFTRAADVLTIVRAQKNTLAVAHAAQDKMQMCLLYTAQKASDIIKDLLVNYAKINTGFIDIAKWNAEDVTYLGNVYTAVIANPMAVKDLVSELILQAALVLWWDDINQQIGFQVLRAVVADAAVFDENIYLKNTFDVTEQPNKRISQVWTFFGQINPLTTLDDEANYRSVSVTVDLQAETDYGTPAIIKIFSRWVAAFGRSIASRINDIQIARYRDPPRLFSWSVLKYNDNGIILAGGYRVKSWLIQDETGALSDAPVQVISLKPSSSIIAAQAEEILFTTPTTDLTHRSITIDTNFNNFNMRTIHDTLFPAPTAGITVTCTVEAGVIVGSNSTSLKAFDVGTWPVGVILNLVNLGRIQGHGGDGGNGLTVGNNGGIALYTRTAIALTDTSGQIWGGGGGGGGGGHGGSSGGGGGGGAGKEPGIGGIAIVTNDGAPGSTTVGGNGGIDASGQDGGNGGGPGLNGSPGHAGISPAAGGIAGSAIDGVSFCTITGAGDRRGPEVN